MSLALLTAVHAVINDVEKLLKLYGLIAQVEVPNQVKQLCGELKGTFSNQLLELKTTLQKGRVGFISENHVTTFKRFRNEILEFELFIDPDQAIPRSGPGSEAQNSTSWMGPTGPDVDIFCQTFEHHLSEVEEACKVIKSDLERNQSNTIDQNNIQTFRDQKESERMVVNGFVLSPSNMVSPLLSPFRDPILGGPLPGISPLTSPMASPFLSPQASQLPPIASLFNLGDLPPIDISGGHTLANLPSLNSATLQRPRKPEKKKNKTIAERRIHELIESQYGNSMAAGVKRKRQIQDHSPSSGIPQHVSERSLVTRTPPPTYEAPNSPKLGPYVPPDELIPSDRGIENGTVWSSLDDLRDALPSSPSSRPQGHLKGKGKQRAESEISGEAIWETASSIHTGSGSATLSSRDSVREGSIFSTASRERTFDDGACTMFVKNVNSHPNAPKGKPIAMSVAHLEVKRTSQGHGRGIVIVARTTNGQEVADNIFLPARNENSKPFLEHDDVVDAMRKSISEANTQMLKGSLAPRMNVHGRIDEDITMSNSTRDVTIAAIVFFAPFLSEHPQYAFANMQDAWDFVSATSSSPLDIRNLVDPDWINNLSLVCSASITSVKSALTHGHVEEASLVTLQVWERDTSDNLNTNPGNKAKQPIQKRNNYERFIRIFRNKSPLANAPAPPATATSTASGRGNQATLHANTIVLDIDCKFLKPPEPESRTGKVKFAFRDIGTAEGEYQLGLGSVLKGMQYIKVAFRDDEAKREFMHEAGFGS